MKHQYADPATAADFMATSPPPPQPDAQLAELMAALGAATLRVVIFDLDTRQCHESWQINEFGESSNDTNNSGAITQFVTAMGTIAQLSQTSATATLIRQLNPRRCAFAWRIDERRVAVAEVRYQQPQTGRRDQDAALLREHFIARMLQQAPGPAAAAAGTAADVSTAAPGPAAGAGPWGAEDEALPSTAALNDGYMPDTPARARWTGLGPGLFALVLFCFLAATTFLIADQQLESLQSDQQRLQTQADATMSRQLTDVLAQGDYGEVQAALDTFAELGYFQDAVVTNAQRRVIALVGTVQDARIGNTFPPEASGTATVVVLRARDQPGLGHLMTWGLPGSAVETTASQRSLLVVASLLSLGALASAGWLLARFRRRRGPGAQRAPHQPDSARTQRTPY